MLELGRSEGAVVGDLVRQDLDHGHARQEPTTALRPLAWVWLVRDGNSTEGETEQADGTGKVTCNKSTLCASWVMHAPSLCMVHVAHNACAMCQGLWTQCTTHRLLHFCLSCSSHTSNQTEPVCTETCVPHESAPLITTHQLTRHTTACNS